jgi:hypothetical protein
MLLPPAFVLLRPFSLLDEVGTLTGTFDLGFCTLTGTFDLGFFPDDDNDDDDAGVGFSLVVISASNDSSL